MPENKSLKKGVVSSGVLGIVGLFGAAILYFVKASLFVFVPYVSVIVIIQYISFRRSSGGDQHV